MSRTVVDATGEPLDAGRPARRVVSLVPSLTETVWLLGRGETLVGLTPYCVEPPGAAERARSVGGPLGADLAAVLALKPDLVLACREENSAEQVARLREAGLSVHVASPRRVAEVGPMIDALGLLLGAERRAAELSARVRRAEAEARLARGPEPCTVTCPVWLDPPMAVGRGTYAADLLHLSGGVVLPDGQGYPRIEPGALDPEVVLLPDEPHRFRLEDVEALGLVPRTADRPRRVRLVDGKALFWYGPRVADALPEIESLLRGATRLS